MTLVFVHKIYFGEDLKSPFAPTDMSINFCNSCFPARCFRSSSPMTQFNVTEYLQTTTKKANTRKIKMSDQRYRVHFYGAPYMT